MTDLGTFPSPPEAPTILANDAFPPSPLPPQLPPSNLSSQGEDSDAMGALQPSLIPAAEASTSPTLLRPPLPTPPLAQPQPQLSPLLSSPAALASTLASAPKQKQQPESSSAPLSHGTGKQPPASGSTQDTQTHPSTLTSQAATSSPPLPVSPRVGLRGLWVQHKKTIVWSCAALLLLLLGVAFYIKVWPWLSRWLGLHSSAINTNVAPTTDNPYQMPLPTMLLSATAAQEVDVVGPQIWLQSRGYFLCRGAGTNTLTLGTSSQQPIITPTLEWRGTYYSDPRPAAIPFVLHSDGTLMTFQLPPSPPPQQQTPAKSQIKPTALVLAWNGANIGGGLVLLASPAWVRNGLGQLTIAATATTTQTPLSLVRFQTLIPGNPMLGLCSVWFNTANAPRQVLTLGGPDSTVFAQTRAIAATQVAMSLITWVPSTFTTTPANPLSARGANSVFQALPVSTVSTASLNVDNINTLTNTVLWSMLDYAYAGTAQQELHSGMYIRHGDTLQDPQSAASLTVRNSGLYFTDNNNNTSVICVPRVAYLLLWQGTLVALHGNGAVLWQSGSWGDNSSSLRVDASMPNVIAIRSNTSKLTANPVLWSAFAPLTANTHSPMPVVGSGLCPEV